ncbi:MAG TPA: ActD-like protein [Vicinamibacteria bacterium]
MSEIRDWQLERYLLGELPAREMESLRAALQEDPGLRARLAALERSSAELLARHPPRPLAAAIAERAARTAVRPRPAWLRPALEAAAGAAALVVGLVLLRPGPEGEADDATRVKGGAPRLVVYRKGPAGIEALAPGSAARAHDVVQLSYQAAGRRFGVIVSVDGRGALTRHLPAAGEDAAPLGKGAVLLPEAYELDDAPRFERFYFVAADEPFPVAPVAAAVERHQRDGRGLELPAAWSVSSVVLTKEDAPAP